MYLRVYTTMGIPQGVYLRYVPPRVYLWVWREGGMLRREVHVLWERGRHAAQRALLLPEVCR